jgi:hypothetical protein
MRSARHEIPPASIGEVLIVADLTVLRSKWRHVEAFVLMRVRKDLFVAESDRMADPERYGAVCRRIRSMETRSCNEVGMVGDYRMISILAISDITNGHERLVKESLEREYAVVDGSDDLIRRVKLELGLKKASWPLVCILHHEISGHNAGSIVIHVNLIVISCLGIAVSTSSIVR